MNNAKFASITADLVVRKGEARPWPQHESLVRAPRPSAPVEEEDPLEADMPEAQTPVPQDGMRRCTLRLSPCEYERLGIVAVKHNTSRQRILRMAVEEYLATVEFEYGSECSCLGGQSCKSEMPRTRPRSF